MSTLYKGEDDDDDDDNNNVCVYAHMLKYMKKNDNHDTAQQEITLNACTISIHSLDL